MLSGVSSSALADGRTQSKHVATGISVEVATCFDFAPRQARGPAQHDVFILPSPPRSVPKILSDPSLLHRCVSRSVDGILWYRTPRLLSPVVRQLSLSPDPL